MLDYVMVDMPNNIEYHPWDGSARTRTRTLLLFNDELT
jgi:hypothetical protein